MKNGQTHQNEFKKVVVIGSSAGGRDALISLLAQFPKSFSVPIVIVQHIAPDGFPEIFANVLASHSHFHCVLATDGAPLLAGTVYIAPANHHVLVQADGKLVLAKGASENRSRPAIDPLFRSAAVAFGPRVIAVLLTGYLDDGTSGIIAVQRCGGTTIVQDPKDATYPDMPKNALMQMTPDYCVPLAEMGSIITEAVAKQEKKTFRIPADIKKEADIAERVASDLTAVNNLGDQAPFNCPGCGGVLWKIAVGDTLRFRCHVGHAYTANSLLLEQTKKVEETMWTALRMFEERRNLLMTMAEEQNEAMAKVSKERAAQSQLHIDRIRAMLLSDFD